MVVAVVVSNGTSIITIHVIYLVMNVYEKIFSIRQKFFNLSGAVNPDTQRIGGRFTEDYDGIEICDVLREVVFMEDSELYDTFTIDDRNELLFHIFKRVKLVFSNQISIFNLELLT